MQVILSPLIAVDLDCIISSHCFVKYYCVVQPNTVERH